MSLMYLERMTCHVRMIHATVCVHPFVFEAPNLLGNFFCSFLFTNPFFFPSMKRKSMDNPIWPKVYIFFLVIKQ